MERKEKIKLLADLNAALESKELKTAIERIPSGELIWQLLTNSLNANIDSLLSDEDGDGEFVTRLAAAREEAIESIGLLKSDIEAIKNSPVMSILQKMGATLQAAQGQQPAQPAQQPQPQQQDPQQPVARPRNPSGRGSGLAGLI